MWTLVVKEHMLPQPLCQSWCTLSDSHSQLRAVRPAGGPGGGGQGSNTYTYKYIHVYRSRSLQPRTAIQYVCLYKYIHARTNTYMYYDVYVMHDFYPPIPLLACSLVSLMYFYIHVCICTYCISVLRCKLRDLTRRGWPKSRREGGVSGGPTIYSNTFPCIPIARSPSSLIRKIPT